MIQLGPLMYALLETLDGHRDNRELAEALSQRLGRPVREHHVLQLARKLAAQGLLAGSEHNAPPRRNPLLALRWKVLVTNPALTRRLTEPFTVLFRPWLMWPIVACFVAVFWFVLIRKGVASATAQAFHRPGLFLLVFVLAIVSAALHELGHAAAARYAGATPGGMGMGLYLVWPAFYTDVTDAYRLPRRDRLRVDLAGLYFNAAVAVLTMAVWLAVHVDALLLLVALQVLQMVKQLSPVIRADGYHILADATGVPDLFAHMVPTLRRLLPGHRREPSALTGWARLLVTAWVLIVVPVLLSLSIGAVVLLPRLLTSAWDSGSHIAAGIAGDAGRGQILGLLAGLVSLLALILPVLGSALVTQRIVRTTVYRARDWSRGHPLRRGLVLLASAAAVAGMVWAWWPSGQYQPIRASQPGTVGGLVKLVSAPERVARPPVPVAPVQLTPGRHLALAMIPVGGASRRHPALFLLVGKKGKPIAIYSTSTPPLPPGAIGVASGGQSGSTGSGQSAGSPVAVQGTAFPFTLPPAPGPGDTQAVAVGSSNGAVTYDVAYSLITVDRGAAVTNTNGAYALASCQACTTVAVSFQLVLVIGRSSIVAPVNRAEALNYRCPACSTTAIADQIVVTLRSQPSQSLMSRLEAALRQLNALPALGAAGTPAAVAAQVDAVQQAVEGALAGSGLLATPSGATTPSTASTTPASAGGSSSSQAPSSSAPGPSSAASGSSSAASGSTASGSASGSSASSASGGQPTAASPTSTSTTTTTSTTPAPSNPAASSSAGG